jgi:diguanylate cyclase (GGDEF)-like protein
MLSTAIADIFFVYFETHSLPYLMPPLNILWMISYWTMLAAAVWQVIHPLSSMSVETFTPLLRNTLIYLTPIISMGFTFSVSLSLLRTDMSLYWTLVGCFTIFALVLLRQYVVLRDNRRLYKQMEQQAVTDSLTGIYNRHFFNEALHREIKRAERYGYPLTILMMDIDNFKAYNDLHGHLEGDILLKEIAAQMKSHVRASDLLARFGGDEFVLILPETNIIQAQAIIKKLHATVLEKFARDRLGISIGSALLQPGMTPQALLAEADRSLYRVKPTK